MTNRSLIFMSTDKEKKNTLKFEEEPYKLNNQYDQGQDKYIEFDKLMEPQIEQWEDIKIPKIISYEVVKQMQQLEKMFYQKDLVDKRIEFIPPVGNIIEPHEEQKNDKNSKNENLIPIPIFVVFIVVAFMMIINRGSGKKKSSRGKFSGGLGKGSSRKKTNNTREKNIEKRQQRQRIRAQGGQWQQFSDDEEPNNLIIDND